MNHCNSGTVARDLAHSFRESIQSPGTADERFYRCLARSRQFVDDTSIPGLLDSLFEAPENRRAVSESLSDILHIGFIFPDENLSITEMAREAERAGMGPDIETFSSTIVSRELGKLSGLPMVPTKIHIITTETTSACTAYVEIFIPDAERGLVDKWVEEEVGTHVGLTLSSHTALMTAQQAFQAEGFEVPAFMRGQPIINVEAGIAAIYFEKSFPSGKVRLELLFPLGESAR